MLTIENLNVEYYRRGQTIQAVRDFSLVIQAGETVGLVGESGSGKSTVALAILRLLRPQEGRITSGRIVFQGNDLLTLPEEPMRAIRGKRISMIFQDPFTSLNPVMRVREQMEEILTAHGDIVGAGSHPRPRLGFHFGQGWYPAPTILAESLARVQLDPNRILPAYPHQLSGGQRQRVMIAMALLAQPEILLADEPTTALDVLVQKDILDLLFKLQRDLNLSMLLISHNLGLVSERVQRIAVMKDGLLLETGTTSDILRQARHPYTRELLDASRRISALMK